MFDIKEDADIPYQDQARRLFNLSASSLNNAGEQQIVPFLGAGVSISGRNFQQAGAPAPVYPARAEIEKIFQQVAVTGKAKTFLEMAVKLACLMQAYEQQDASVDEQKLFESMKTGDDPPSAGELAQLLSVLSPYSSFRRVVDEMRRRLPDDPQGASRDEQVAALKLIGRITGIANPPDSLTGIADYYESMSGRESLWQTLSLVIARKKHLTRTHKMLAAAADAHFKQAEALDYLIITTNYDCLMEDALDARGVPYVVLSTRCSDHKVLVRFSKTVSSKSDEAQRVAEIKRLTERNSERYPNAFTLQKPRSLVVLYKIHGDLCPELDQKTGDGVIISDNDYVNYISQMNTQEGTIPVQVSDLMRSKPFLFLGYSLNDWNVRSIFQTIREKRYADNEVSDFSVMYSVRDYEKIFFQRNNVLIFKTNLNAYVDGVLRFVPQELQEGL